MKNLIVVAFDDPYFNYFISFYNSIQENYSDHPVIHAYYKGNNEKIMQFIDQKDNVVYKKYREFKFDYDISLGAVGSPIIYFKYFLWTD
ncbi:MAG: hypothetical protein KFF73_00150, partial [Cyclobacteriaceae bacterium]|nr:hypothetical protein [Cyclobacteriaceae bacterium]